MTDNNKKILEKEFVKWAEARDDDWWGVLIDISDARIFLEFCSEKLQEEREECLKMKGQIKREWYQEGWSDAFEFLKKGVRKGK